VIAPVGELDLHTVRALTPQLDATVDTDYLQVMLDPSAPTLVDSTALGASIHAEHRFRSQGRTLSVVAPRADQASAMPFSDEREEHDRAAGDRDRAAEARDKTAARRDLRAAVRAAFAEDQAEMAFQARNDAGRRARALGRHGRPVRAQLRRRRRARECYCTPKRVLAKRKEPRIIAGPAVRRLFDLAAERTP
jgi:hypothetical protein